VIFRGGIERETRNPRSEKITARFLR